MLKKISIEVLPLAVLLLLAAPAVLGEATKTTFMGIETPVFTGEPDRQWVDEDGVLHIRGLPVETIFQGTPFNFINRVTIDLNLDLATGDGDGTGAFTFDVTWGELRGTFQGIATLTLSREPGRELLVSYVGHGAGDFEGMKIMGNGAPTTPGQPFGQVVLMHEGIVLSPHG